MINVMMITNKMAVKISCIMLSRRRCGDIYLLLTYATSAAGVKVSAPKDGASKKMKTTDNDSIKATVGSGFLNLKPLWVYFSILAVLSRMAY